MNTPSEPLIYAQDGHIVTLTLNRAAARNPITDAEMVQAIETACARIEQDMTVRAVILTGAGSAFSSGGNVKHMRDREGMFAGSPAQLRDGYRHGVQRIPLALWKLNVPTIAAVNGPAVGAGCDLACMCDMRIATDTASFAESFVKVGIIPGDGGAWFLPRLVGLSRACEMAFTGEPINAQKALEWGLVSEVVGGEQLLVSAQHLARRIAANPPQVLRMTKRLIREGQQQSLDSLLELSASMQALAHHTADHREALAAMLEKRPGVFRGE